MGLIDASSSMPHARLSPRTRNERRPFMRATAIVGRLQSTCAVTEGGIPLVLHHGTRTQFKNFEISRSRDIGMHFGTWDQAVYRLRKAPLPKHKADQLPEGRIVSAALRVRNPCRLIGDPQDWEPRTVLALLGSALNSDARHRVTDLISRRIEAEKDETAQAMADYTRLRGKTPPDTMITRMFSAAKDTTRKLVLTVVRDALQEAGYDGLVYPNQYETPGRSAVDAVDFSWVVFDADQIIPLLGHERADALQVANDDLRDASFYPGRNPCHEAFDSSVRSTGRLTRGQTEILAEAAQRWAACVDANTTKGIGGRGLVDWSLHLDGGTLKVSVDTIHGTFRTKWRDIGLDEISRRFRLLNVPHDSEDVIGVLGWNFRWQLNEEWHSFEQRVLSLLNGIRHHYRCDLERAASNTDEAPPSCMPL